MTPLIVFSDPWAEACADAINRSAAYRQAAQAWEGAIMLVMLPDPPSGSELRIWLDLWHGECRAARAGMESDEGATRYILAGSRASWKQVLEGRVAPLMALMTGKLKLTKGNLAELLPYVASAKELVLAVSSIQSAWPEGS